MKSATLAVVAAAQFLIALDYSIIQVALPRIADDLRLDGTSTPWIISAYAVMFAGLLVVGGRLTDRLGARRVFVLSVLAFGAASAAGAAAGDPATLLVARGGQGVAAALLQPAVLALIGTTFPAGAPRARALAVWGSVGASGLAAGALLGGVLTEISWRLTFLVNVPVTLALAAIATRIPAAPEAPASPTTGNPASPATTGTPPSPTTGNPAWPGTAGNPASPTTTRNPVSLGATGTPASRGAAGILASQGSAGGAAGRLPLRAAVSATGAVLSLLTALTLAAQRGWSTPPTLSALALSAILAAIFITGERRATSRPPKPGGPEILTEIVGPGASAPTISVKISMAWGGVAWLGRSDYRGVWSSWGGGPGSVQDVASGERGGLRRGRRHSGHGLDLADADAGVAASREARRPPTADVRNVPLIPSELRHDRALRVGASAAALYMASVGAEFFLLTLLLQAVDGYSPLRTGLAFLPLAASVTAGSSTAGRWMRRRPAPTVLASGFALSAAGLAWLAANAGGGYPTLLPGLIASGVGHGMVYTSMFTLGTSRAPGEHQGTAGALVTTAQYVAGAIAVALLTLLLGASPGHGDFGLAFGATAAAALAGAALAVRAIRRV